MRGFSRLHLALAASACMALTGCETVNESASGKPATQLSGNPRLAAPGTAVAAVTLPDAPADTLYPVTVALQDPVDPELAAESTDPALRLAAVPLPYPAPRTAVAEAAPAQPAEQAGAAMASALPAPAAEAPAETLAAAAADPAPPAQSVALLPMPAPKPAVLGYAAAAPQSASLSALGSGTVSASPAVLRSGPATSKGAIDNLIAYYSQFYGVPETLVHRVVHRESRYNPKAFHKNGYFGLMQIQYATAKSMGYQGPPDGLFDADTNLRYAIKYLRGAYLVAGSDHDNAVRLYARGYYYDAKRKGMLHVLK